MGFRVGVRLVAIVLSLGVTAACGRSEAPSEAPQQAEPLFKPIDPSAAPVVTPPGPATTAVPPATLPPGSSAEPMAMVTDLAAGWPVNLRVGQSMSARLTADRASGGRWSLRTGSDAGIVAPQGEPVYEATAGTPGVEVFLLKAVKPGQTTLTFDFRKGTAGGPLRSATYPVTVQ